MQQKSEGVCLTFHAASEPRPTSLHLWALFSPKSGAIVKVKETVWPSDALPAWRGFIFRALHERMAMDSLTR